MTLDLTEQEIRLIVACLAKQPWELVNGLISKVQAQMVKQEKKEGEA